VLKVARDGVAQTEAVQSGSVARVLTTIQPDWLPWLLQAIGDNVTDNAVADRIGKEIASRPDLVLAALPYIPAASGTLRRTLESMVFSADERQLLVQIGTTGQTELYEVVAQTYALLASEDETLHRVAATAYYLALETELRRDFNLQGEAVMRFVEGVADNIQALGQVYVHHPKSLVPKDVAVEWAADGKLRVRRSRVPPDGTLLICSIERGGKRLAYAPVLVHKHTSAPEFLTSDLGFNDTSDLAVRVLAIGAQSPYGRTDFPGHVGVYHAS
jgi:hypothetical protein